MKKVLITGCLGFVGCNLIQYLFKYWSYQVIGVDALTYAGNMNNIPEKIKNDSRFSFWYGNVRSGDLMNELVNKADVVINLAGETHVARSIFDNAIFYETNVMGAQSVSNAVLKNSNVERFIHISTSEVYGTALTVPMDEKHPLNPTTPYASAKAGADRLVYSYWKAYDIPAVIVRPFNQFGFNQHLEKVIPRFITSALLDEPLTIHGSGEYTRDWMFVEDLCRALERLICVDLDKVKGQAINIGTGRDISINEIADIILDKMNKPKSLIKYTGDRLGQVDRHIASTDKAFKLLNWKAETTFEQGIDKTIEWYKNNPDWWKGLLWMRQVPIKNKDGKIGYH